ncbi:LLM class flavin-dependent oxidoreductase [Amycolatopsis thermalba]|uniref:LLM class flavin-dependent oxidoreductase n=1 Tax=Amycolatopsis thermalba TaxID=944492 RepID=A0ABY4NXJ1_9PSEU|nr:MULTISPECIES: LLM class flavin-dependent oxidoreductase [Amycolatopsis]UQS24785.1 LLM class flavin-dependent oxidoreductase [Amycolatopsis thermalba]
MTNLIQNYNNARSDYDVFKDQIELSVRADQDGYYSIGCVEHHFDPGCSMCPDNTQFLSYLAGRTKNAKLHTTAVILPWNDPLRVVEKIALLDNLSDGRALFGMGRGLARREYEGFGLEMGESRERFDEAAEMVMRSRGRLRRKRRQVLPAGQGADPPASIGELQGPHDHGRDEPRLGGGRRQAGAAHDGVHPGAAGDHAHADDRGVPQDLPRHPRW